MEPEKRDLGRWGAGLAAVLGTLVLPGLWLGHPPHGMDHSVHLANAVDTERLLRTGRVVGWSDLQFTGHLLNGFYPPLGNVLTAATHWLAHGWLSWDGAYALTLLAFLATLALAVFSLSRRAVGDGAALAAVAITAFLDHGGKDVGGGAWYLTIGVWQFGASIALCLLALVRLPDVLREGTWRAAIPTGVLSAVAVLTHPIALMVLPLYGLFVPWAFRLRFGRPLVKGALQAGAVALGLSGWWLVPFLLRAGSSEPWFVPLLPGASFPVRLLIGRVIPGFPEWLVPLAIAGSVIAIRSGEPWRRWLVAAAWIPMLLTYSGPWTAFARLSELAERLQWIRFLAVSRLLFAPLALVPVEELVSLLRSGGARRRQWLPPALALGWSATLAVAAAGQPPPIANPERFQCYTPEEERALARVLNALPGKSGQAPVPEPTRLGLGNHNAYNDHCLMLAVPLSGRPVFKTGWTPATVFGGKFFTSDPAHLARDGVSEVLVDGPAPEPYAGSPLVAREGRFEVRALSARPRARVDGEGSVAIRSWSDEQVELQLDGPAPAALHVRITWAPEWKAYQDGKPVPLEPADDPPGRFLRVQAHPGPVVLRFERSAIAAWLEVLSALCSAALLGFAAAQVIRRHGATVTSSASRRPRHRA